MTLPADESFINTSMPDSAIKHSPAAEVQDSTDDGEHVLRLVDASDHDDEGQVRLDHHGEGPDILDERCVELPVVVLFHYQEHLVVAVLLSDLGRRQEAFRCDARPHRAQEQVPLQSSTAGMQHSTIDEEPVLLNADARDHDKANQVPLVGDDHDEEVRQMLAEQRAEFLVVVFLHRCRGRRHKAILREVRLDHAQNVVLLQSLTAEAQGAVRRVGSTQREAVVHDEVTADVGRNIVSFFVRTQGGQ
mmetsp:Transcript_77485/g.250790  ORF Transcript_77485/g.250790 Transcript_77485/m.250790 type:complete len:247 (-) Transcript_77485:184-924(-)